MNKTVIIVILVLIAISAIVYWFFLREKTSDATTNAKVDTTATSTEPNTPTSMATAPSTVSDDEYKPYPKPCGSSISLATFKTQVTTLKTTIKAQYQRVLDCRANPTGQNCKLGIGGQQKILPFEDPSSPVFGLSIDGATRWEAMYQLIYTNKKCVLGKNPKQLFEADNLPVPLK